MREIMATDNANKSKDVNLKDWAGSNRDHQKFKKKKIFNLFTPPETVYSIYSSKKANGHVFHTVIIIYETRY